MCSGIKRAHFIVAYTIHKPALPRKDISMHMCIDMFDKQNYHSESPPKDCLYPHMISDAEKTFIYAFS